jgi:hypothetical protein
MADAAPHANDRPVAPPNAPTGRQAADTIRGFVYQGWQSVYAWATLSPNEELFLEHAEDFDRATAGSIEATQVKDTAGTISLGREDAREALNHFWAHSENNPDRRVSLRFLTRAERGTESGRPFGDRKGMDVWDEARRPGVDLGPLRTFLLTQNLDEGLLRFVRGADDETLRREVIQRVHWDTEAPARNDLKGLIQELLVLHGEAQPFPVPPSDARRALGALYTRAMEVASASAGRRLTRADFLEAFEEATTVRVPAGDPRSLEVRAFLATRGGPSGLRLTPGEQGFLEHVEAPRLERALPRGALTRTILDRVEREPLLVLRASSGMGKSTLAELAAAEAPGPWYRLDFRSLDADTAAARLNAAAVQLAELPEGATILLDDLALGPEAERYETALARLLVATRARAGRLVATAHHPIPSRIAALLPPEADPDFIVLPLSDEEVVALARVRGCPADAVEAWGQLIWLQTAGHPQLADANAARAAREGWLPIRTEDVVTTPEAIERVQEEARQRLYATLRGTDAYALAERLSVFSVPFSREHALRLAEVNPALREAAPGLDLLVGPWVERVAPSYLRVSPLLARLYRENLPAERQTELHAQAADALLTPHVGQWEVSGALMHGLLGENGEALLDVTQALSHADGEAWNVVAPVIAWFAVVGTGEVERPLFPSSPAVSLHLRALQFRVAAATGRDALPVVDAWVRELDSAADRLPSPLYRLLQHSLWADVLTRLAAPIPFTRLIQAAERLLVLQESAAATATPSDPTAVEGGDLGLRADETLTEVAALFTPATVVDILAFRCTSSADLATLVGAAGALEEPLQAALFAELAANYTFASGLVNRPWIRESKLETPDWDAIATALDQTLAFAVGHGLEPLIVGAALAQAIVHVDFRDDRTRAEQVLAEAEATLGRTDPHLTAYLGKLLVLDREDEDALRLFEDLLPAWAEETSLDPERAYAYTDAIIAAGRLGRWSDAARWARAGAEATTSDNPPALALGFACDEAFALFKSGAPCDAVRSFGELLERLPEPGDDLWLRQLYRRLSHTLVWIEAQFGGWAGRTLPEPPPGYASSPDPDATPDVEVASPALLWGALGELEQLAGCNGALARRAESFVAAELAAAAAGTLLAVQGGLWMVTAGIRSTSPDLVERHVASVRSLQARFAPPAGAAAGTVPPLVSALGPDSLAYILTHALFAPMAADGPKMPPLTEWRAATEKAGLLDGALGGWFDTAALAVRLGSGDRSAALPLTVVLTADATADPIAPTRRVVAALALAKGSLDPTTRLQALLALVDFVAVSPFRQAVASPLARLAGTTRKAGDRDDLQGVARLLQRRLVEAGVRGRAPDVLAALAEGAKPVEFGRPLDAPDADRPPSS